MGDAQQMKSIKNTEKTPWWARLASLTQRPSPDSPAAEKSTTAMPVRSPAHLPMHLQSGQAAEDAAAELLQTAGLRVLTRNYKTPGRGGGEIDIIARDGNTLVFVEVRQRKSSAYGGAAASISPSKQARWRYAAQVYVQQFGSQPPDCRFDAVLFEGGQAPVWLRGVMQ
jgi:putative endonuclease